MSTTGKPAGSLAREIKRRKVLQTCGYYAVACMALLFLADQLLPLLGVEGDGPSRTLLGLAVLGLPVAAVVAWRRNRADEAGARSTSFVERRVLRNMAPVNDKRHGGHSDDRAADYSWLITAETGPLKNLTYGVLDSIVVGRSLENDLALVSPEIDRRHARFELRDGKLLVEDLGTSIGTVVNGERISGQHELAHDDEVRFHEIVFRVSEGARYTPG